MIKHLAWWLCFLFACALLVVTGTGQVQRLASAHHAALLYLALSILLTLPAGIVTLASGYLLEALLAGWSRSSLKSLPRATASVRLDMLSMAMALVPHRILGYLLSLGLLYLIDTHVLQPSHVSLTQFLPTWGVQVACLVLFQSFIAYWVHRLEHTIPALWALHQFHHSADRMSILTAVRQTELSKAVEQLLIFSFAALLSEPLAPKPSGGPLVLLLVAYLLYRCFIRVNQYLVHSNLTTDYGWIGRWLLVSPRMHRLHHATAPEYYNKNFTFDLVIWDRLFGTYASCDEAALEHLTLGIEHSAFNSGEDVRSVLRDYFVTPYVVFWRSLRAGPKAWRPVRFAREPVAELGPVAQSPARSAQ
jgi:sterol desaturase/sphingolipid hydroxylase (fatty acid hydroxylase superfamily)